jgi:hypothetical protein
MVSPADPTDPTGTGPARAADDVDRVQARLIAAQQHIQVLTGRVQAQEAQLAELDAQLRRVAAHAHGLRADAGLAFAAGLLLGFAGLAVAAYFFLP